MSQEQPTPHSQRPRSNEAAVSQQRAPTVNMLPFSPAANANNLMGMNFLPYTTSYSGAYPPFPYMHPFLGQYPVMSPHRDQSHTANSGIDVGSPHPYTYDAAGSKTVEAMPPISSPPVSLPQGYKRSRLPSDAAARKAPKKAQSSPQHSPPVQMYSHAVPTKQTFPLQKHAIKQADGSKKIAQVAKRGRPLGSKNGTPKLAKATLGGHQLTPHKKNPNEATPASRKRRLVLDEEDETGVQVVATIEGGNINPERRGLSQLPSIAPRAQSERSKVPKNEPTPQLEYDIPEELQGVCRALGPYNWSEYLTLMEQLWTGNISGQEFAASSKSIFLMFDEKMRKKMNNMMAMQVVVPMLERRARTTASKD
jgi:hypothetical protein